MNLLKAFLDKDYIFQEKYDCFVHIIYEARQGIKPLWFDLLDEIERGLIELNMTICKPITTIYLYISLK